MGRARGRRQRQWDKAFSRGGQVAVATGNYTGAVRAYALGDAINAATGGRMGSDDGIGRMRDMPRDPRDNVAFGPSQALAPAPIDPSRPDTGRPEPRINEYPVAWNIPGQSNRLVPWSVLRQAADSVDIMRRCISVRQEQLQGMKWAIGLDEQVVQHAYAASDGSQGRRDIEAEMRRKFLPEIQRLTQFWCYPWSQMGLSLEQWVNGIMEDHLVLDAVAIYPRVTYGGEVLGFEIIDPTTIKLLIDYRGSRPQAPFPAYQQDLWGFPRGEFTATTSTHTDPATGEKTEVVEPGMTADQLFYFRENFRSWTPYGYSAVEQALISARLYLKRQGWMLAEYDDGSTPLTWLVPDGKDGNLVDKLTWSTRRQWEDSLNDELTGQTRARHRVKVGIPGMNPVQMSSVDERYKPEYDMHLIKMLAGHFGVTSSGLGFSEAKGLGNSGLHEGQASVQEAATTKPDTRMVERMINELSRTWLKMPAELCFRYVDPETEDAKTEDDTANAQRLRGTITINEDRRRLGLAPLDMPEADALFLISGKDATPVDGYLAKLEEVHAAEQQALAATTAASEAALAAPAEDAGAVEKAAELSALTRWRRRRGDGAGRAFICKALAPHDFPGGVPADVDFAEWVWVADHESDDVINKDYSPWWPRDSKGRWVKRGGSGFDAGPANPGKQILAGLREQGERDRAARAATVDVTAGSAAADKLRRAETMYGTDRSKWPAKARQDAAKLDRQVTSLGASSTVDGMTTPPKLSQTAQARLRRAARDGAVYADSDRAAKDIAALERAGLLEPMPAQPDGRVYYRPTSAVDREALAAPVDAPLTPAERADALRSGMAAALGGGPVDPNSMGERIRRAQEQDAREVIESLAGPGGWASMVDVRRKLEQRGMDRGQQDIVLRRMATEGDRSVVLSPEENQKTLTDADHAAAIDLGAGPQHVVMIEPKRKSVLDTVRESSEQAAAARSAVDSVPGLREGVARQQRPAAGQVIRMNRTGRTKGEYVRLDSDVTADGDLLTIRGTRVHADGTPYVHQNRVLETIRERHISMEVVEPRRTTRVGDPEPASADDGPVVVRQAADSTGYALPTTPPANAARDADPEAQRIDAADTGKAQPGSVTARSITLPDTLTEAQRTRFAETGRKLDERHAEFFPKDAAEAQQRLADARRFAAEEPGGRADEEVRRQEGYAKAPRGDAAVQATKAARELVEMADARGMAVMISHDSATNGAPFFEIQAVDPVKGSGFKATFHTFKGKDGSGNYGYMSGDIMGGGGRGSRGNPSITAIRESLADKPEPTKDNTSVPQASAAERMATGDVRAGDWRYHPSEGWQQIGMISDKPDAIGGRTIWGADRETRLGVLPRDERPWIARQTERPSAPPPPEALKALQRKPGEPTKRGDVYVVERTDNTYGGNTGTRNPRKTYEVHEVTSVTRDGKIKAVRDVARGGTPMDARYVQGREYGRGTVLPGDAIDKDGLAADLKARTYDRSTTPKAHDDLRELSTVLFGRVKPETWEQRRTETAATQSVNDAMQAQMLASIAGGGAPAYGRVATADIKAGTRMIYGGHVVEATGPAKPSRSKDGGHTVPVIREDQGIPGTMHIGSGQSGAPLAAPKPDKGGARPKAEASSTAPSSAGAAGVRATRDDALAAAPRYVDADDARKLDAKATAAIERYRGKDFTEINRELRGGTPSTATRRTVEQLDRAMADSRLTSDIEVHRGVGDIDRMFGDAARRKLTGAEWTDNAPQSTTTDPDVAERFLVGEQGRRGAARIVMRVPAGVGAIQLSDGRYEAELLLQRGLRMRVVDDTGPWRRGQKNVRTITVEVVPA